MDFEESADDKSIKCKSCSSDKGFRFDVEAFNTDGTPDDKVVVNRNIKIEE